MTVRKATLSDLEDILEIYAGARNFMRESGNPTQWQGGYPYPEVVQSDIEGGILRVIEEDGELYGVFAFITEGDTDYASIDGAWLNDRPYGVIHRIAVAKHGVGVASFCFDYAFRACGAKALLSRAV